MSDNPLFDAYRWHREQYPRMRADRALTLARDDGAAGRRRYPARGRLLPYYFGSWQQLDDMPRYAGRHDRAFYCDAWPDGWRLVGRADEVARAADRPRSIDHTGWYTTDEGDDGTIAGYVLRLPHGRLIPGIAQTDCDGVTLYPIDSYSDAMECARAADGYAERAAERERDYQRAWRAGSDAAYLNTQAIEHRREIIEICRAARADLDIDAATWATVKWRVSTLLRELCDARRERDKLRADYGREPAFADGFA